MIHIIKTYFELLDMKHYKPRGKTHTKWSECKHQEQEYKICDDIKSDTSDLEREDDLAYFDYFNTPHFEEVELWFDVVQQICYDQFGADESLYEGISSPWKNYFQHIEIGEIHNLSCSLKTFNNKRVSKSNFHNVPMIAEQIKEFNIYSNAECDIHKFELAKYTKLLSICPNIDTLNIIIVYDGGISNMDMFKNFSCLVNEFKKLNLKQLNITYSDEQLFGPEKDFGIFTNYELSKICEFIQSIIDHFSTTLTTIFKNNDKICQWNDVRNNASYNNIVVTCETDDEEKLSENNTQWLIAPTDEEVEALEALEAIEVNNKQQLRKVNYYCS